MPKHKHVTHINAYSMLVTSGVLWGFSAFAYKNALFFMGAMVLLAMRYVVGAIFLYVSRKDTFARLPLKTYAIIAGFCLIGAVYTNLAYAYGIQRTTIVHASIVQLSVAFFVYLFAALLLKARIHRAVWLGAVLATIGLGVALLQSPLAASSGSTLLGDLALLSQAVSTAIGVVLARYILSKRRLKIGPEQLAFLEYVFAALFFIGLLVASGNLASIAALSIQAYGWGLAVGIIVGALPIRLYYSAVKKLPTERIADIDFINPSVAIVSGVLLLNESFTLQSAAGLSLVAIGLLVSHNKLHPVTIAHKVHLSSDRLVNIYRLPKRAYEFIRY